MSPTCNSIYNRRNELERCFLHVLGYNVNVSKSLYTSAFFNVKNEMPFSYLPWALEPLLMENIIKIKVWDLASSKLIAEKAANDQTEGTSQRSEIEASSVLSIISVLPPVSAGLKKARSELYLYPKTKRLYFI